MEKTKNTLSLFNGMGCVWLALEESSHKIGKRYSSEIEKFPNQANDALYPDTIQLGDVRNVDVSKLEPISFLAGGSPCQSFSFAGKRKGMSAIKKHEFIFPTNEQYERYIRNEINPFLTMKDYVKKKRIEFNKIERNDGVVNIEILTLDHYIELKEQNFEFEGQSYLFWEYIRILTDIRKYNPDVKFLLENVIMGAKWQKVITQAIGINPIRINAALVSAQNRDRLFWTNIYTEQDGFFGDLKCMIPQPKDKGILLKDVLENEVDDKYFLSGKMLDYLNSRKANYNAGKINYKTENDVASCINASSGSLDISDNIIIDTNRKARCFTAGGNSGGLHSQMDLVVHNTMPRSSKTGKGGTEPLSRNDGKTYCLDTGNTNAIEVNIVAMRGRNPENPKSRKSGLPTEQQLEPRTDGKTNCLTSVQKDNLVAYGCDFRTDEGLRIRENGKSGTLAARARNDESCGQLAMINKTIRRLTPRECMRLQTVPEDKIDILLSCGISDTQLYKMAGNGWCIKVISHILKYL